MAEQHTDTYAKIIPNVLVDHSQSDLLEAARELAARWSAPVIITTSVRFFETLFSECPTVCRKLHNIAGGVVIFDEAQSLPANLISATLRAVNALCSRYHTTMVFSTATQPDFSARKDLDWTPCEILPEHRKLFEALKRVDVEWRLGNETPLEAIAEEKQYILLFNNPTKPERKKAPEGRAASRSNGCILGVGENAPQQAKRGNGHVRFLAFCKCV